MKILVLSRFTGLNANVIRDFLFSFNAHSKHEYYYVHDLRVLDRHFDFNRFDAIVMFWSHDWLRPRLSADVIQRIAAAAGSRFLFLQDEYRSVHLARQAIRQFRVNVLFTLVAERDFEVFYPRSELPDLRRIVPVLTGYVPSYLERTPLLPNASRPVDIAYRSRTCAYHLGDLAREKLTIAERFYDLAARYGLRHDISVWEGDRLYGQKYVDFLLRARTVLGTESGASVVDFEGQIQQRCEDYIDRNPTATYEEVKERFFADVDGRVTNKVISPRIFESAALGNTLVLHEGDYSGVLTPGLHYIPVKKDYSNADEVMRQIMDRGHCQEMARRTYQDLIASGRYNYRQFTRLFDAVVADLVPGVSSAWAGSKSAFYTWNFIRHGQGIIPRGEGFIRVPNIDLIYDLFRKNVNRVGLRAMRQVLRNPQAVQGLRSGTRVLLHTAWSKIPAPVQASLRPVVTPVSRALRKTLFRPF